MTQTVTIDAKNDCPIQHVTVYSQNSFGGQRAQVERVLKLDLKVGFSRIVINKLSTALEADSVRVEIFQPELGAQIQDVNVAHPQKNSSPIFESDQYNKDPELEGLTEEQTSEFKALTRRRDLLNVRIRALEKNSNLLAAYGDALVGPHTRQDPASDKPGSLPSLSELEAFLDIYPRTIENLYERAQDLQEDLSDVQKGIEDLLAVVQAAQIVRPMGGFSPKKGPLTVSVLVETEISGIFELKIKYHVLGPCWKGSYDIHTQLPKPHASVSISEGSQVDVVSHLKLTYRASIIQQTGEDWDNVSLTLSTARPSVSGNSTVPEISGWRINVAKPVNPAFGPLSLDKRPAPSLFGSVSGPAAFASPKQDSSADVFGQPVSLFGSGTQQQQQQPGFQSFGQASGPNSTFSPVANNSLFGGSGTHSANTSSFGGFGAASAPVPAKPRSPDIQGPVPSLFGGSTSGQTNTQQQQRHGRGIVSDDENRMVPTNIQIEGKSSIASDGSSHNVHVTNLQLDPIFEWIAVPVLQSSAFLQCKVKNTSNFVLVGGFCSVIFDGNFVTKSHIPNVNPSEDFICSLGIDPAVKITYYPAKQLRRLPSKGGAWSALTGSSTSQTKTETRSYESRIAVKNTRGSRHPLTRIILRDRIPVSEDERINVSLIVPTAESLGPLVPPKVAGAESAGADNEEDEASKTIWSQVRHGVRARWAQKTEKGGGSKGDGVIEWVAESISDDFDVQLGWEVSAPEGLTVLNQSQAPSWFGHTGDFISG